jgi:endonuclease/exonuclease/phosphatase family metal-dependent hydrolase
MPYYYLLKWKIRTRDQRNQVIDNLLALREQLDRDIPAKDAEQNLLLATWNIRDLGKPGSRRGFGKRLSETHFYIAEVLSRFDLVAVQEVNQLGEWETIMDILGPDWDYIATDVTDPKLGGNGERMTFAFDKRKVWFKNIAGEIVLPRHMLISKVEVEVEGERMFTGKQFRRTPFVTSFQSGWFKFDICTVHIYYGAASGSKLQQRIEEIREIADYLGNRADAALRKDRGLILLGDFNIVHPEHQTMQALLEQGFVVPQRLRNPSNVSETHYYDQIAFKTKPEVIEYVDKAPEDGGLPNGGVFDIFESVFTEDHFEDYKEAARSSPNGSDLADEDELRDYYLTWRTYQFSDHKPMWVRLNTNESQAYLEGLKG